MNKNDSEIRRDIRDLGAVLRRMDNWLEGPTKEKFRDLTRQAEQLAGSDAGGDADNARQAREAGAISDAADAMAKVLDTAIRAAGGGAGKPHGRKLGPAFGI